MRRASAEWESESRFWTVDELEREEEDIFREINRGGKYASAVAGRYHRLQAAKARFLAAFEKPEPVPDNERYCLRCYQQRPSCSCEEGFLETRDNSSYQAGLLPEQRYKRRDLK